MQNSICRGRKSHCRNNHLIACRYSQSMIGAVQRGRAAIDRNSQPATDMGGKGLLKISHGRTGRKPVATQNSDNGFDIVFRYNLTAIRQKRRHQRS
jgi:hypothetical protein